MRRFWLFHFAVLAIIATLIGSPPARAQNSQSWIASNGTNNGLCSRGAPCANFDQAYALTNAGGEINCADSGAFGPLTIEHSLTINCTGTNGTLNNSSIRIRNTAATDVVVLKGLDIDLDGLTGTGSPPAGMIGFTGAGVLHVENTRVSSMKGARFSGIHFQPTGSAKLFIVDSSITNFGDAALTAGIYVKPDAGVTADVSIERSRVDNNFFGIIADGTAGGIIRGIISDSFVIGNVHNGITVSTSGSSTVLTIDNTKVSGNSYGLVVAGSNGGLLVGRSIINANATGLYSTGGALLLSYRDNRVNANALTDGTFAGFVNTQ